MLTSKELLERSGISRATLNNYIALGILPRPEVLPPEPDDGAAPRIGYFPPESLQRIEEIQRLKNAGWSMNRIASHFGAARPPSGEPAAVRAFAATGAASLAGPQREMPRLSVDAIAHPAYLAGPDLRLIWFNTASAAVLGPAAAGESVLSRLLQSPAAPGRDEILRFHLGVARQRGATAESLASQAPLEHRDLLERLAQEAQSPAAFVSHVSAGTAAPPGAVRVYAIEFREGVLFVHVPGGGRPEELGSLVEARELVVGSAGRRRLPALGDVAVLVMELEQAARIWSALPAEEYFELIDEIWLAADPIVRRHRGVQGKHPRDGLACYFLRQRDSGYAWNALLAAHEMRDAMRRLSKQWQLRKGWSTELCMNTGVDEGQQWVGGSASGAVEFTMYGETLTRATCLSGFARAGAIWASKNVLAKLAPQEQQRLNWGIRERGSEGADLFVPCVFRTVEALAEPVPCGWRDIAGLPITEIVDVGGADGRRERAGDQPPI